MNEPQKGTLSIMLEATASKGTDQGTTTASLDTLGADYATVVVNFNSEINTDGVGPEIVFAHGDGTTYTTLSTLSAVTLVAEKAIVYHVDMRGKHRYLKFSVTPATATNDDLTIQADGILYRQVELPGATSDMADVAVIL